MEEIAEASMKGGKGALAPELEKAVEEASNSGQNKKTKARREARKKRSREDKEELGRWRQSSKGGGKGEGKGKSSTSEEVCFAWNNKNGLCAGLAPGEKCKGKVARVHKCSICGSPGHPSKDCSQKKS